ncbi:hypothetical protein NHJ13734_003241 [Beauveria thailandica]
MATPITTSSAGAAGSSAKTFRISDVPNDWDKEKLESCMGNYFQTVSIQSLAPRIDGRSGQATAMLDGPVQNANSNETSIIGGLQWDTDFYGMTTLFAPPPEDHKLDIIVVSGLGGHAFDKVTKRPMARVIIYGHRSHVAHSTTIQGYSDISASFLHSLRPLAAETPTTPIMFIGHSLGGIIIKQQVPGILHDLVDKFHETKASQGKIGADWHWREQDLAEHLAAAISKSHALWLFVDALDEGGAKTANDLIEEFTALIDQNCASNGRLHICFTCRRFPILRITGGFELAIDKRNKPDIRTFVQSGISQYHCLLQAGVADAIIDGANGIFLWARLAVDEALRLKSRERTPRQIYKVIRQMPKELEELFASILSSKSDEPAESLLMMQWICFAANGISVRQMRWAIVIDADRPGVGDLNKSLYDYLDDDAYIDDDEAMKRRIVVLSCGLAEVVWGRVQFIHQAVKEFFLDQGLALLRSKTELEDRGPAVATVEHKIGHLRLARTCLQYMWMFNRLEFAAANGWRPNMKDFKNFAKIKPSSTSYPYAESYRDAISHRAALINEVFGESWVGFLPLLWYADKCWMQHVAESEANVTRAEDSLDYSARPPEDFSSHRVVLQKYPWESKHLEHLYNEDIVAWAKALM